MTGLRWYVLRDDAPQAVLANDRDWPTALGVRADPEAEVLTAFTATGQKRAIHRDALLGYYVEVEE